MGPESDPHSQSLGTRQKRKHNWRSEVESFAGPVAMHPLLAKILQEWRRETMYAKDSDWILASDRMRGTQPRTATTMVSDYIRPAAVRLGIIEADCPRFGFHNLRHALTTFLIHQGHDPDVVRRMLRHSDINVTMLYAHMDSKRIDAQAQFLQKMMPDGAQIQ